MPGAGILQIHEEVKLGMFLTQSGFLTFINNMCERTGNEDTEITMFSSQLLSLLHGFGVCVCVRAHAHMHLHTFNSVLVLPE